MATTTELVRVVRDSNGELLLGAGRGGRGAWLCADSPTCLQAARKRRAFERALRGPLAGDALAILESELFPPGAARAVVCEDMGLAERQDGAEGPRAEKGF